MPYHWRILHLSAHHVNDIELGNAFKNCRDSGFVQLGIVGKAIIEEAIWCLICA